MKFSILIIFLSFPILQAQEQLLYVEILTWAINFQNHETIKYTMENVGQVWCKAAGPYPAYPQTIIIMLKKLFRLTIREVIMPLINVGIIKGGNSLVSVYIKLPFMMELLHLEKELIFI